MRKFLGYFALVLVLFVGSYYIATKYLFLNITPKGIISRLVPPSKNVKNLLPQGPDTPSQFNIPQGYYMDIYADLKGELPRVLAFDNFGNLLVSVTNRGKVLAILDTDKNGKSDKQIEVLSGLNKPHGIVVYGGYLYVAETDKVSRYIYDPNSLTAENKQVLFDLPGGGRHFTRTIKINNNKLYTSVGSSCDTCEEKDNFRASILVSNLDGSDLKVYASGLRNTVFFTFDSDGRLWGNDMGRDNLGDNLPPDELNIILEGQNYGWPFCYGNKIVDAKFNSESLAFCSSTSIPVFDYPAHSAPLGILKDGNSFLVALHGSWNSSFPVGYKIVKINTFAGAVAGMEDYISGFTKGEEILGRPVDLVFDSKGRMFISDDHAGVIYVLYK